MNPSNRFLQELAAMPIVEGVTAHSIIAVEGDGDPEDGADGIVMYKSAHIDGVASEKIVRSSHSAQGHPETIREIKRILFEHLGAIDEQERAKEPGIQATGARLKAMPSSGF